MLRAEGAAVGTDLMEVNADDKEGRLNLETRYLDALAFSNSTSHEALYVPCRVACRIVPCRAVLCWLCCALLSYACA